MKLVTRLATVAGLLLALSACQGVEGDPGEFKVRVVPDATITSMTLTGIGIPVSGGLPDPNKVYRLEKLKGTIYWSVTTPGPINYYLRISKKPTKGEEGDSGLLPYVEGFELPPLTASRGEDGDNQRYIFYLSGGTFMTLYGRQTIAGTPF